MPGSPQVNQGTLNRLRGSVVIANHPELNVTAPFLDRDGISIGFEGPTSGTTPTMTGTIQSPEPFQIAHVSIALLKTQNLANLYKKRVESNVLIGDVTVIPDSSALSNYNLANCSISGVRDISLNGTVIGYVVSISGAYPINSDLWAAT